MAERFPIVDLQGDRAKAVATVRQACKDLGFFQVINHAIPTDLIEEGRRVGKQFFDLSLEEKMKFPLTWAGGELFGYAKLGLENADTANVSLSGQDQIPDLMESFQVGDVDLVQTKYPFEKMKEVLEKLYTYQRQEALRILELLAESLDLPSAFFVKQHTGKHRSVLRVTKYPKLTDFGLSGKGISRISPHKDLGSITLLFQDMTGGLEVQEGDTWHSVPPVEGCIVVNMGNLIHRWTNQLYKSSIHRVITNENSTANDRYSVIMFVNPNDDAEVGPLPSCVTEDNPPQYEPAIVEKYLSCKLTQIFDPKAREFKGKCKYDE